MLQDEFYEEISIEERRQVAEAMAAEFAGTTGKRQKSTLACDMLTLVHRTLVHL